MRIRDILLEALINLANLLMGSILDICLTLIAFFAAYISLKTYKSSIDPQIEFYLDNDPDSFKDGAIKGNIFIKLKNYGKTPAYNMLIKSNKKFTEEEEKIRFQEKSTIVDLEKGKKINFLSSDSEKWFVLLDAEKVYKNFEKLPKFDFCISWESKSYIPFFKNKKIQENFTIDYNDMKDTLLNYKYEPITRSLDKINTTIEKSVREEIKNSVQEELNILLPLYKKEWLKQCQKTQNEDYMI